MFTVHALQRHGLRQFDTLRQVRSYYNVMKHPAWILSHCSLPMLFFRGMLWMIQKQRFCLLVQINCVVCLLENPFINTVMILKRKLDDSFSHSHISVNIQECANCQVYSLQCMLMSRSTVACQPYNLLFLDVLTVQSKLTKRLIYLETELVAFQTCRANKPFFLLGGPG